MGLTAFQVPVDGFDASSLSESTELQSRFVPKRKRSVLLADSYRRLEMLSKADRVENCGTFLEFDHVISADGVLGDGKLHNANFCRDRFCPMCAWRRTMKIFGQASQIMEQIHGKYLFVFVTLTVVSVSGDRLPATLDRMFESWNKFTQRREIKKAVSGFYRALEVTRNTDSHSKSYGLYHPHFHVIFAVPLNYFEKSSSLYIQRDRWLQYWQESFGDPSISQVDVRRCRDSDGQITDDSKRLSSAVAEVAKYTVKDADYLFEDLPLTDETVKHLSDALYHRRLVSYGGCFRKAWQEIGLDDPESGDLVHLDDKPIDSGLAHMIVRYEWSVGVYKVSNIRRLVSADIDAE